jgi:2-desacetyl-2-hydroxyethyl bacteriochlorophyllide A dehydrogenase
VRAAFYQARRELDVRDAPDPEPGPDEVLVRVAACGICGTDQHIYEGDFFPSYPLIGGHELAGEVVALGSQSVEPVVRAGDRVAVDPSLFCGSCFFCQRAQGNHCLHWNAIGVTRDGGFAEYVVAPTANVYPIGDMPYEVAAFIEPISCVVYGLQRLRIPVGANALVYGAGPIGLLMLQLVARGGASTVAVVDLKEDKLKLARSLGAHEVVSGGNGADDALTAISPLGFDVVIDCTGVPAVVEHMFTHVRRNGKLLFFGVNPPDARIGLSPYDVYQQDLEILGSFALRYTFHDAFALLESGAVDVLPLLSERFPIERFPEALELAASGEALKVLIEPMDGNERSPRG